MGRLHGHRDPTPAIYVHGTHRDGRVDVVFSSDVLGVELTCERIEATPAAVEAMAKAFGTMAEAVFAHGLAIAPAPCGQSSRPAGERPHCEARMRAVYRDGWHNGRLGLPGRALQTVAVERALGRTAEDLDTQVGDTPHGENQ